MKKITLFVLTTLCICTITFAQKNIPLELKAGQEFLVENVVSTKTSTEVQGQSMENNADISTTYHIAIKEAGDVFKLENTIKNIQMAITNMGIETSFNSDKKEDLDGPIGASLKEFIGKPMNVAIDKSGKIVEEKKDSATDEGNLFSNPLKNFEKTGFGAIIAFHTIPQDLKVGDTWTDSTDDNRIAKTTHYIVKELNGDMATIGLSGKIVTDMEVTNQGMAMNIKTSGTFTGTEIVNANTGVIQSNNVSVKAEGFIEVMGQQVPTSSQVTSTTTVKSL